ncbi:tumor susceptibility gene 101 protein isoform X2 [Mirounga angustirostris]|uniref:tumor susceptibility gene 101 protein isoform X2 n=1 Tax=Mirounga angustirostris TaxID=9716 RepID=UPI00313CAE52
MAVSESQLKKMVSKYKYRDLTVRETVNVITLYKDLKPVLDSYVFNDGSSRELMNLTGTIPVPYKGNTYNIPICLWLLDTYPYNPPICFVKPTSSMTIKTGKHVDANGKIYLPYLHEWKHPQSDLLGLIQVMIVVFGDEPPVFSRPTISASYPPYQATGPPNTSYIPGMPSGISAYPSGYPPNPSGYPGCPFPPGGQYPATTSSQYPSQPPVATVGPSRDGTISEDTIRASLISAVSDKLRWRMKEEMDRAQAELNALKRTEEDLKKGHQKLEEMVTRLDQEVAEVDKNIELLRKKDEELSSALEKMENQSENNDIDEVIIPTAPLYKQILNLYAEENAIEDTIFYLGEALRRGVIDLDVFLKPSSQLQHRAPAQDRRARYFGHTRTGEGPAAPDRDACGLQGAQSHPQAKEIRSRGAHAPAGLQDASSRVHGPPLRRQTKRREEKGRTVGGCKGGNRWLLRLREAPPSSCGPRGVCAHPEQRIGQEAGSERRGNKEKE